MSNQITIFVLGTGIKSLGIQCALGKCLEMEIRSIHFNNKDTGRSRGLAQIFNWQDPLFNPDEFKNRLNNLAQHQKRIILFPPNDTVIDILKELSNTLTVNLWCYRHSSDTIKASLDKSLVVGRAAGAGLYPHKRYINSGKLTPKSSDMQFPVIVKPRDEKLSKTLSKHLFITNENDPKEVFKDHNNLKNRPIIQEFIPGDDDQIYHCNLFINNDSNTIGGVEFQKLRQYLPQRGTASYGQTMLSRTKVTDCQQLADAAGYRGQMNVEFKRDSRTKVWIFINVNLRLPVYSSSFPSTRINLAHLYVKSLAKTFNYPAIANHISILMRAGNDCNNILTRKVKISSKIWLRQIRKVNSFAYRYDRDPIPGFDIFEKIILFCLKSLLQIAGQVLLKRKERNSAELSTLTLIKCFHMSAI